MSSIKLVLADDDVDLLEMLEGLVGDLGYDVVGTAGNGLEALAVVLRTEPDVVLLDLRMPFMTGTEVAMELRRERPQTPVILLSAYDDRSLQKFAAQAGVREFLVKGCSAREITAAIEAAHAS